MIVLPPAVILMPMMPAIRSATARRPQPAMARWALFFTLPVTKPMRMAPSVMPTIHTVMLEDIMF